MAQKVGNGLDLQGQRISNVADPTSPTDAATRAYADNIARGLTYKVAARAASTGNISLSAPGANLDTVALVSGDRILLKNQTNAVENGIYVWTGASAALTRSTDFAANSTQSPGTALTIKEGATNANKLYAIIAAVAVTVGASSIAFDVIGGGTTYSGINGVAIGGQNISAVAAPGGGLQVITAGIQLDPSVAVRKASANVGNGSATSIAVVHNLGTKDVTVSLRETATDAGVITDWAATDTNTVTFSFAQAPGSGAYRATIHG